MSIRSSLRASEVRRRVFALLRDRGAMTGPEIAEAEFAHRTTPEARKLLLLWARAGYLTRTRVPGTGSGSAPYRYALTELGLAVLAAEEL